MQIYDALLMCEHGIYHLVQWYSTRPTVIPQKIVKKNTHDHETQNPNPQRIGAHGQSSLGHKSPFETYQAHSLQC